MKLYADMTEDELANVDLCEVTGLKIGDRVRHKNEGKLHCPKVGSLGTIVGHQLQGLHHWGGICVTVKVQWDNNDSYVMGYQLAIPMGKENLHATR